MLEYTGAEQIAELINFSDDLMTITNNKQKEIGKYDLTDLIREISKIDKLERIRVSSIEITEIDDKFIEELANNRKLCAHLHVSLQSGSERILKIMNRKYTKCEYLEKIGKLKNARPDINLTTDVIVGFPTETEEEFLECVEYCKLVEFSKIHVFPYSKREGTKAAQMDGHLSNSVKKERARRLIEIDNDLQLKYNEKFINKKVKEATKNKTLKNFFILFIFLLSLNSFNSNYIKYTYKYKWN